jgi:hypothetical protein
LATGDVGLGGFLSLSMDNSALAEVQHGSAFQIMSFSGEAYGIAESESGVAIPSDTIIPEGGSPFSILPSGLDTLFPSLDVLAQRFGQGIFLTFLDPSMVGGGASGADFNGDGVVDATDLAIWSANKGLLTGASVLQGDANMDGAVDATDYFIWLEEFTMGPGAGGGGLGSPSSNVPEPTGLALLAIGGLLAAAFGRRRS